jgi:3-methyl-2-oxobutanoate hydroxymethyltransferase
MSVSTRQPAITVTDISKRKNDEPLVCVAAYTTPVARIADRHCDIILVGDSVGMVLHGLASTLEVTMDMMILHGKAVRRGVSKALMVVDMPFGSYEESRELAFRNAATLMRETGCTAVKLEGGETMADTISYLTERGIPVVGHIGLTPQSVHNLGGYSVQGRGPDADRIVRDAHAVAAAGAFALVIEKVTEPLARLVTSKLAIPTIGIGASPACDGQILVADDLLGNFTDFKAKFVKRYADHGKEACAALERFAVEVRERRFPAADHVFADVKPSGSSQ